MDKLVIMANQAICKTEPMPFLKKALTYSEEVYIKRPKRAIIKRVEKTMMTPLGTFPTGLLPMVEKFLTETERPYTVVWESLRECHATREPKLDDIVFTPEQKQVIELTIQKKRGVIEAPTGLGKTVIAAGIISAYPEAKVLFLCHTLSLISQTEKAFNKYNIGTVSTVSSEGKSHKGQVVISTVHSMFRQTAKFLSQFDIIIVDECHHISDTRGMYAKCLVKCDAPIRIGLSATIPKSGKGKMVLEGWLGPQIDKITMQHAIEAEYLATPKLRIIKLPVDRALSYKSWKTVMDKGIIHNSRKNNRIARYVREYVENGKSVLIYVQRIEHGEVLLKMISQEVPVKFIRGISTMEDREIARELLNEKKIPCIIATTVWKEGVNIPTLDVLINAAEGKSERAIIQTIGRGLRRTKDKLEVTIIDFFDPSNHILVSHFGERLCLYMDMGWI